MGYQDQAGSTTIALCDTRRVTRRQDRGSIQDRLSSGQGQMKKEPPGNQRLFDFQRYPEHGYDLTRSD